MTAKDRYEIDFQCKGCGQAGIIQFSENDYPYTPPERTAKCLSGAFSVSMKDLNDASARCSKCGHETIV